MATTTPDDIYSPDSTKAYALTADLGAMAASVQAALWKRSWYYVGTDAQRLALTAPDLRNGIIWEDITNGRIWQRKAGAWDEKDLVRNVGRINPVTSGNQTNIGATRTNVNGTTINLTLSAPTLLRFYGNVTTYSASTSDVVVVSVADGGPNNNLFDATFPANSSTTIAATSRAQNIVIDILVPAGAHVFTLTVARAAGNGAVTIAPGATSPTAFSIDRIG